MILNKLTKLTLEHIGKYNLVLFVSLPTNQYINQYVFFVLRWYYPTKNSRKKFFLSNFNSLNILDHEYHFILL